MLPDLVTEGVDISLRFDESGKDEPNIRCTLRGIKTWALRIWPPLRRGVAFGAGE